MEKNQPTAQKIYFELTNACNFRCDFCPVRESKRRPQMMDFALYKKGIDEIAEKKLAPIVGYHVLGEPLLYPQIFEAVRYARNQGLHTEINTNGSLLSREHVRGLAEAGLDDLAISVQIIDPNEHACRESGMTFERYYAGVLEGLGFLRQYAPQMDVALCLMNTSTRRYFDIDRPMRLSGTQEHYRRNLIAFVSDLSGVVGYPRSRAAVAHDLQGLNLVQPQSIWVDPHTRVFAQPFADWGNAFTSRKIHGAKFGFCGYALENVGVLSSGEVTICCGDYDGKTALGNLREDSLAEILASQAAESIREGFRQMWIVHPHCQHCLGGTNVWKTMFKSVASIYLFKGLSFRPARRVKELFLDFDLRGCS